MSELIPEEQQEPTPEPKRSFGRPQKYPWQEWQDGQVRIITTPHDFLVPIESMRAILHQRAKNTGQAVNAQKHPYKDGLVFRFYDPADYPPGTQPPLPDPTAATTVQTGQDTGPKCQYPGCTKPLHPIARNYDFPHCLQGNVPQGMFLVSAHDPTTRKAL